MEPYFDKDIPTEVITEENTNVLICLVAFWTFGAIIPLIFWPTSYATMVELEHKTFPENKTYKFDRHLFSNEVYAYIQKFTKFHKHKARIFTLRPRTYENRSIKVMHLGMRNYRDESKKGGILVIGGIRSSLWDSVAAAIDLMHKLLEDCRYKVPFLVEYDWYIIPIANPDGYDYTLSMRDIDPRVALNPKNRNPNKYPDNTKHCRGVYLDRNFVFHWGESKPEDYNNYCWEGYAGPHPLSENETIAISRFVNSLKIRRKPLTMYLQLHGSKSRDDITYPWRFTKLSPFHQPILDEMAKTAAGEVRDLTGISFTYIQGGKRDTGSGLLIDWLMGIIHVLYNFSIEPTYIAEVNSTDVPEQRIYMEKAITIVFALAKQLRKISSSAHCLFSYQTCLISVCLSSVTMYFTY